MHRITNILALIAVALLLVSCTSGKDNSEDGNMSGNTFPMESISYIADARFETVLKAIENKDKDGLKTMFSERALSETVDIDASIDYLFDLIEGDIISWENVRYISGDEVEQGKVSRRICSWYTLTTTEASYPFFLLEYDKDEIEPDNQGLYALRGIREENAKTQWGDWVDMRVPGVYMP